MHVSCAEYLLISSALFPCSLFLSFCFFTLFESISDENLTGEKKNFGFFADVYGVMMVPKEIELDKESGFELRLQVPDVRLTMESISAQTDKTPKHRTFNIGFLRSREVGEFLSGALAGAMTKAALAPLETIRTRMVVGVGSRNIAGSFIEVIEQQGWQGLWSGNTINMLRIIPTQAIELGTFEWVKRTLTLAQEKWNQNERPKLQIGHVNIDLSFSCISPVAVGGAAAGIVSTLACHPLEVLKDRLTVDPKAYPTISLAFQKMYRDGGIGAFYAGISPTLIGMLPYSTCYYFMYERMKRSYCQAKKKASLNRAELLLIGALSGLTASTISYPLEVARKRLMVGSLQGRCPPHMAAALAEVIQEEGLGGLYRGWGASCLKVMPNSGITWMFYEAWKDILLIDKPHL